MRLLALGLIVLAFAACSKDTTAPVAQFTTTNGICCPSPTGVWCDPTGTLTSCPRLGPSGRSWQDAGWIKKL